MLFVAITKVFLPTLFWIHELVVPPAMTPPATQTVSRMKTKDIRITMRKVADWRQRRLLFAIFQVKPDFDKT